MPDIRLTRIDNRLIHGQVATQWCGVVGANLLLVANDADTVLYDPEDDRHHPQGFTKSAHCDYLRDPTGCAQACRGRSADQESKYRQHAHG